MNVAEKPSRFLLLHSETGGGHRQVAQAVAEALTDGHASAARAVIVDALVGYAPWPLCRLPDWYGAMLCAAGRPYSLGFRLLNGRRRTRGVSHLLWPWVRTAARRLLSDHPPDVVVCFHPLLVHTLAQALEEAGVSSVPLVAVGTDLVVMHAFWANRAVRRYLVATEAARGQLARQGVDPSRVEVTGLPVSQRIQEISQRDPRALRSRLGLEPGLPLVVLMGGGEGFGPMERVARALARAELPAQIAVLTGHNERVRARLSEHASNPPLRVEGFAGNAHEWMRAADLLVTKAGPVTLAEALLLGVPLVLWGAIPAQETPNVWLVVDAGAGVWVPEPRRMVTTVRRLLTDQAARTRMRRQAQRLVCPEAAARAAGALWEIARG